MSAEEEGSPLEALMEFLYLVPVGLLQFGADGAVRLMNPLTAQLLLPLAPRGDLTDAYAALSPLLPDLRQRLRAFNGSGGLVVDHARCEVVADGAPRTLSLSIHLMQAGGYLAVIEDVTQLATQERQIDEDRQRMRAILEHVRDYAIYTADAEGRVDRWNPSMRRLGGWRAEDVLGRSLDLFRPAEERDARPLEAQLEEARRAGSCESEGWRMRADGSRFWANVVLTGLPDQDGRPRGFVVVSRDMTERKRLEDQLRELATTDPLTGAFNRRHGQDRLAEVTRAGGTLSVLLLDVDHFKAVNDRHGHEAGDAVLRALSATAQGLLPAGAELVRWGGEEFLVILPGHDADAAGRVAEALRAAIEAARVDTAGGALRLTASLGVAACGGEGPDALVRRADAALYAAKRAGRNRVAVSP